MAWRHPEPFWDEMSHPGVLPLTGNASGKRRTRETSRLPNPRCDWKIPNIFAGILRRNRRFEVWLATVSETEPRIRKGTSETVFKVWCTIPKPGEQSGFQVDIHGLWNRKVLQNGHLYLVMLTISVHFLVDASVITSQIGYVLCVVAQEHLTKIRIFHGPLCAHIFVAILGLQRESRRAICRCTAVAWNWGKNG